MVDGSYYKVIGLSIDALEAQIIQDKNVKDIDDVLGVVNHTEETENTKKTRKSKKEDTNTK